MASDRWKYRPTLLTPWVRNAMDPDERAHFAAVSSALPEGFRVVMSAKGPRGPYQAVLYGPGTEHARVWRKTPREALDVAVEGLHLEGVA